MAEFAAPQFQNPDLMAAYLRGQQGATQAAAAPIELAGAQQDQQYRGLQMDQLRQTMQNTKMYQQIAQGLITPDGMQQPQSAGGGIQNGPQGSVSAQEPGSYNGSVGGLNPNTLQALALLRGDDPLKTAEGVQNYQMQQKKLQMAGPMSLAETIANSPQADMIVKNNPDLQQRWVKTAPMLGLDPFKDLTPENARKVAAFGYNNMASQAGLPPKDFGFSGTVKPGEAVYQNGRLVAGSPDAMTPYQQQELQLRKQEAALADQRFKFEQGQSKIPSGYEVNPDDPTGIRPIAGGPKDPSAATSGGLGGRDGVMFQRVTSAANAGVKAIENIAELPIASSSGWLSGRGEPHSLFGSVKDVLAQKVTGQDAQTVNVMFSGLSRNLATLETAGLSPGGSLTHSLENLKLNEGDTQMTKIRKLAEMRQIVEENLSPNLANPKLAPTQKELVQNIITKVQKAVPFTQHDVTQFESSKNPRATIMDFAKSSGVQAQADKNSGTHPPEIQDLIAKYK